jgi:hypothetical protein
MIMMHLVIIKCIMSVFNHDSKTYIAQLYTNVSRIYEA